MRGSRTIKSNIGKHLEDYSSETHLCSIYNSFQEQLSVVVPYIKIGLARQEQCVYFHDENTSEDLLIALKSSGIDVDAAIHSHALMIISKKQIACRFDCLDYVPFRNFLPDAISKAKSSGFNGVRVLAEMSCSWDAPYSREQLVEFVAKFHQLFEKNDASLICLYNRNSFPPEVIEELIYIHPVIIFADLICKNKYYIPPEEYLSSDSAAHRVNQLLISMSVSEYLRQRGNN